MLELVIVTQDGFDDSIGEFVDLETVTVRLEHSLVSLSKWESKWEVPFLDSTTDRTDEMWMDYIRFMHLDPVDEKLLTKLSSENMRSISEYINSSQTATWFADHGRNVRRAPQSKKVTSDLVYYWMSALSIPFECQHWHFNRLITLIRIAEAENQPQKKMGRKESMAQHRSLLASRRRG